MSARDIRLLHDAEATIARLTEERDRALSDHATMQGYLNEEARLRREAQDENMALWADIRTFYHGQSWAVEEWKNQAHVRPLWQRAIARAALDGGKGEG